jgi:hypothetical protein
MVRGLHAAAINEAFTKYLGWATYYQPITHPPVMEYRRAV